VAITEDYLPAVPPREISPQARQYLDLELRRIADALNLRVLFAPPLGAPPAKPENGVVAYANGTDWDPGSGEGFYGYENGGWVKL